MMPNDDLIRRIMLDISEHPINPPKPHYSDYNELEIDWHLAYLIESKYLKGKILGPASMPLTVVITGITPSGYNLIHSLTTPITKQTGIPLNPPYTVPKKWHEKPLGKIALGVAIGLIVAYLVYQFGWNDSKSKIEQQSHSHNKSTPAAQKNPKKILKP